MNAAQLSLSLEERTTCVLDEFRSKAERPTQLGRDKPKPRRSTRMALESIAEINSLAELRQAKGYMSAAQYRVFSQCGHGPRPKAKRPR